MARAPAECKGQAAKFNGNAQRLKGSFLANFTIREAERFCHGVRVSP